MENNNSQPIVTIPRQSRFLAFMCLLSFIIGTISIIIGFSSYFKAKETFKLAQAMNQTLEEFHATQNETVPVIPEEIDIARKALEKAVSWAWVYIISTVGSMYAVFLMWKQKKVGFYMFTGIQLLSMILSFLFLGKGLWTNVFLRCILLSNVLFIVLYGIKLKRMY